MVQREPRSAPPEMTLGSTPGRGILRGRFQGISLEKDRICPEPLQTASPRPSGQPSGQPSGSSRHSCREALRTAVRKLHYLWRRFRCRCSALGRIRALSFLNLSRGLCGQHVQSAWDQRPAPGRPVAYGRPMDAQWTFPFLWKYWMIPQWTNGRPLL